MTPLKVFFTGLEIDPTELVPRIEYGVIPSEWRRYRFLSEAAITDANRYLSANIDGRWAILSGYLNGGREITIAFEHDYDASLFILSDGPKRIL